MEEEEVHNEPSVTPTPEEPASSESEEVPEVPLQAEQPGVATTTSPTNPGRPAEQGPHGATEEMENAQPQVAAPLLVRRRDLTLVRNLGQGPMGTTRLFRHNPDRRLVVVKTSSTQYLHLRTEAEFTRQLSGNKYFLSIVECLDPPLSPAKYTLFREYFPGQDLKDFLMGHPMIFFEVQCVLRQLGEALHFLHSKNILHMDVNSANILVNDSLNIKLIDFNHSMIGPTGRVIVGARRFRAPEVGEYESVRGSFRRKLPYSFEADYYSLGMTAIHMSANLWHIDFLREVLKNKKGNSKKYFPWIKASRKELNPEGPRDSFFDLMSGLLAKKPPKRLGDRDFLSHPFFEEYFEVPLTTVEQEAQKVRRKVCMHRWCKRHRNESPSKISEPRKRFERKMRKRDYAFYMTEERLIETADFLKNKYKKPKKPFWSRIRGLFGRKSSSQRSLGEDLSNPTSRSEQQGEQNSCFRNIWKRKRSSQEGNPTNNQTVQEDGPSGTAGKRSAKGLFRRWKKKKKDETLSPSP